MIRGGGGVVGACIAPCDATLSHHANCPIVDPSCLKQAGATLFLSCD